MHACRRFTFFFERILVELVEDDFVLPFWNWDNQTKLDPILPNILPHFYRNPLKYPALYHSARHLRHLPGQPPLIADLVNAGGGAPVDPEQLRDDNNTRVHRYTLGLTANTSDRGYFLSMPIHLGERLDKEVLTFENEVLGRIHLWLGDDARDMEDMGSAYGAVRDPIFFTHHTNVDRMWTVWEEMGGQNYNDSDFLEADFFFYNEHAQLVRVTIADCLDHHKLIYNYQEVDNPWATYHPLPAVDTKPPSRHTAAS